MRAGEIGRWLGRGRWPQLAGGVFCGLLLLLFAAKFVASAERLAGDRIAHQRAIVAAVHQVFPGPVPYLDHSGMIGSFPKANGFMSSWGVSSYAAAGVPFMPAALERRPPLLLVNWPVLDLESPMSRRLLPQEWVRFGWYFLITRRDPAGLREWIRLRRLGREERFERP